MTLSRRSIAHFIVRVRYFVRFRQWPRDLTFARMNLSYGQAVYLTGTKGEVQGVYAASPEQSPRPFGVVERKNADGTYTVRVGGKVEMPK